MSEEFLPYIAVILTGVLSVGLVMAILIINAVIGPKRTNPVKGQPFECGSVPVDTPRKRLNVKYYVVAIFFVVFDIEAVLLFPWAVTYRDLLKNPAWGSTVLIEVLVFIGILAFGLWYVWSLGALDWAFDKKKYGERYE